MYHLATLLRRVAADPRFSTHNNEPDKNIPSTFLRLRKIESVRHELISRIEFQSGIDQKRFLFRSRKNSWVQALGGVYTGAFCAPEQGCQMAYFQTRNPELGKFWRVWQYVEDVGILYGHLGYTYYSY
jgi:hypothetical protein